MDQKYTMKRQQVLLGELEKKILQAEQDYERNLIIAQASSGSLAASVVIDVFLASIFIPPAVTASISTLNVAQWTDVKMALEKMGGLRDEQAKLLSGTS